jgi:hypothetical protein
MVDVKDVTIVLLIVGVDVISMVGTRVEITGATVLTVVIVISGVGVWVVVPTAVIPRVRGCVCVGFLATCSIPED